MKEDIPTSHTEIKWIKKEYYEQHYGNKFNNLDEKDTFLEGHKLCKLTQEEIENFNRPIASKEIELVTKNFPGKA